MSTFDFSKIWSFHHPPPLLEAKPCHEPKINFIADNLMKMVHMHYNITPPPKD